MNKWILIILCCPLSLWAQAPDSLQVVSMDRYYEAVMANHPIAKQAQNILVRGDMAVMQAKGAFDPKLVSEYNTKHYGEKEYYEIWDSYVKIPTPLNVDVKAGYERNSGEYLNPEHNVPEDGLYYMGISVPLGKGLIYSDRRVDVAQAKLTQLNSQNEARLVLSNLILDASYAYWSWYSAYQKMRLAQQGHDLAMERFMGVREAVLNGEEAVIDSVEAFIIVQQRANDLTKAQLSFQNTENEVLMFMWEPAANDLLRPMSWDTELKAVDEYLELTRLRQPAIQSLQVKNEQLELERKRQVEMLKPELTLNYNVLLTQDSELGESAYFQNNYKAGFQFSFPLFLRKERAKLQTVKLKGQENSFKLEQKEREYTVKVQNYYSKVLTMKEMVRRQEEMVENYRRMLVGEKAKFDNGESSVFLVNSRDSKMLAAQYKMVDLIVEMGQTMAYLEWLTGGPEMSLLP